MLTILLLSIWPSVSETNSELHHSNQSYLIQKKSIFESMRKFDQHSLQKLQLYALEFFFLFFKHYLVDSK